MSFARPGHSTSEFAKLFRFKCVHSASSLVSRLSKDSACRILDRCFLWFLGSMMCWRKQIQAGLSGVHIKPHCSIGVHVNRDWDELYPIFKGLPKLTIKYARSMSPRLRASGQKWVPPKVHSAVQADGVFKIRAWTRQIFPAFVVLQRGGQAGCFDSWKDLDVLERILELHCTLYIGIYGV